MTAVTGTAGVRVAPPPPPTAPRRRSPIRRRLLAVFVILLAAMGFLLYKALTSAVVYFKTAQQAVAARSTLGTSTFQIEGVVVPGSVHDSAGTLTTFKISSGSTVVTVVNSADPPSLFAPSIPVVLQGHFQTGSDVFAADQILVKHSNQYIAAHPNRVRAPNGSIR